MAKRERISPGKLLAITLGDPCGIGPEIAAKAIARLSPDELGRLLFVGPFEPLRKAGERLSIQTSNWVPETLACGHHMRGVPDANGCGYRRGGVGLPISEDPRETLCRRCPAILDTGPAGDFPPGKICREGGMAAIKAIETAHDLCLRGICDGMVTGPIGKMSIKLAGSRFSGHTDMLGALTGARTTRMAMVLGKWRVVMTTLHVSYRQVLDLLTTEAVLETLRLAHEAYSTRSRPFPRLAVGGLNPHAGEGGLFGDEEKGIIAPAVEAFRKVNPNVSGPFPSDSLFKPDMRRKFDVFICQTHDQGLSAIKALGSIRCVNVTLGLPYVRTSVGHGTGYDIAGKGESDPSGLISAIREARRLTADTGRKGESRGAQ